MLRADMFSYGLYTVFPQLEFLIPERCILPTAPFVASFDFELEPACESVIPNRPTTSATSVSVNLFRPLALRWYASK